MASEPEQKTREQLVDDIRSLGKDIEAALEAEIAAGRGRLADLVGQLRNRIDELDETEESEPDSTSVEKLRVRLDELADEIDEEVEEGRKRVKTLVDDLDERLSRLEARLRPD